MTDLDISIKAILQHYRIQSDFMWSEVQDEFYTQKEYEKALKKLEKECINRLKVLF